jgi:hypothetical protein
MDTDVKEEQIIRQPEKELLAWKSPSRLFKKRDKEFFINIGVIVLFLVVILVLAQEFMFILAVLSIVFFVYVVSTIPPEDVEHRITTLGIESAGRYYRWEELTDFWFEEQWGQIKIMIQSPIRGKIMIILGSVDKTQVKEAISRYIPYRDKPQKTWMDNAGSWISEKIPLDKPV